MSLDKSKLPEWLLDMNREKPILNRAINVTLTNSEAIQGLDPGNIIVDIDYPNHKRRTILVEGKMVVQ